MTPSTAPRTYSGSASHFRMARANSMAIRSISRIASSKRPIVNFPAQSGLSVTKTITAAMPAGVTMVGKARGLAAKLNEGGRSCAPGVAGAWDCRITVSRAARKRINPPVMANTGT
jgi:hypothetical protein